MTPSPEAEELVAELPRRGLPEAEVFEKRGRSRRFSRQSRAPEESAAARAAADAAPVGRSRWSQAVAHEAGWALRAGDHRRSFFHAATGGADVELALADSSPHPLRLAEPRRPAPWSDPPELDQPLATESAAAHLFEEIERELRRELPASRLVFAVLEDGAAESSLLSTHGVRAAWRARAAALRLEVEVGSRRCTFEGAESCALRFEPRALALRLSDRLCALEGAGERAAAAGGESAVLLAAPLAARLVQALAPLFFGLAANDRIARLGALSPALSLLDDGRTAAGVLAAPFDGEGLPTGPAVLVEAGRFVGPLLAWWEAGRAVVPGCARRASWRDLPRRAATHFYIAPATTAVAELVESVVAGCYLLDAEGAVRLDPASLAFEVPVSGLDLAHGRAVAPLGRVRLCGDVASLLAGIRSLARDLQFVPGDGMFGAPSMLVDGLRVLPR